MNRREFFKLGGKLLAFSFIFTVPLNTLTKLPTASAAGAPARIYRGGRDGSIQVSKDGGKTWQAHSKFVKGFSVVEIFKARDGHWYTRATFKQRSFYLMLSKDEKLWLSQPIKTPIPHA